MELCIYDEELKLTELAGKNRPYLEHMLLGLLPPFRRVNRQLIAVVARRTTEKVKTYYRQSACELGRRTRRE